MAFPDWLPIEYPGVFDPFQIIDDELPVPFEVAYGDQGGMGPDRELVTEIMGGAEIETRIEPGNERFEVVVVQRRTHQMGMIDFINPGNVWAPCAAGADPGWEVCE